MMQAAANTLRRFRRAATLLLALTVILGVVFLVDQQGVGPAAGRWTITQVTNGPEGPSLPAAKVGDQFLVLPNGYAVPWDHAWHGVIGWALCGWKCFIFNDLSRFAQFRIVLADDARTFTLTSLGGYVVVAERKRPPRGLVKTRR